MRSCQHESVQLNCTWLSLVQGLERERAATPTSLPFGDFTEPSSHTDATPYTTTTDDTLSHL